MTEGSKYRRRWASKSGILPWHRVCLNDTDGRLCEVETISMPLAVVPMTSDIGSAAGGFTKPR